MVEQATSFTDRIESARGRLDDEIGRVQKKIKTSRKQIEKQIDTGRKSFERQLSTSRKSLERQTRKQVKELRKSSVVQEVERLGTEVNRQIEGVFERVLGVLQVASKTDVDRIDRKLTKLNKRLKDMERGRKTNGQSPSQVAQGN